MIKTGGFDRMCPERGAGTRSRKELVNADAKPMTKKPRSPATHAGAARRKKGTPAGGRVQTTLIHLNDSADTTHSKRLTFI